MRSPSSNTIPPRAISRAVLALRRRLLALADAMVPPALALFEHGMGVGKTQLLGVAARLRLADLLAEGPRTSAELAALAGADEPSLFRVLRALASFGVFALRADGRFENTRLSEALRAGAPATSRDFMEYLASPTNVASWADLEASARGGGVAFQRVHGMSVWAWLALHPEEERTFAAAMVHLTELAAPLVAAGYPFGRFARVCDVAGGKGTLLAEILRRHPRPRGVLFDAPTVVAGAPAFLGTRGVAQRVECVGGDFFQRVPDGCDASLLKDVLHDWDDEAALRILAACRRAAPAGARLLVAEVLVERDRVTSPGSLIDVQMMMATDGGRQRSAAELHELLRRSGFTPGRVIDLAGVLGLVEASAP